MNEQYHGSITRVAGPFHSEKRLHSGASGAGGRLAAETNYAHGMVHVIITWDIPYCIVLCNIVSHNLSHELTSLGASDFIGPQWLNDMHARASQGEAAANRR